jgi:hypothetical protein
VGPVTEQVVKDNNPHGGHGLVWEGDMSRVGVKHGMAEVKLSCYKWLSVFPAPKRAYCEGLCL